MIKNRKITTKLIFMLTPLAVTLILFVIYFGTEQIKLYNKTEEIFNQHLYQMDSLILNADRDYYQAALSERTLYAQQDLSTGEKTKLLADFDENAQQTTDRFHQAVDIAKTDSDLYEKYTISDLFILVNGSDAEDPDGLLEQKQTLKDISEAFDSEFAQWQNAYDLSAGKGDFNKRQDLFEKTRSYLNSVTDLLGLYSQHSGVVIKDEIATEVILSVIVVGVVFIVSILVALYVALYLRKNIKHITNDMVNLANNDLSITPYHVNSKDEMGELSRSANILFNNLQKVITDLIASSDNLTTSSTVMNQTSTDINMSIHDMHSALSDMSNGAVSQADDTEKIAADMNELNEVMINVAQTTENLADESNQIEEATTTGMEKINDLLRITESNNAAFNNIFHVIENISESTERISEASRLISDIAEQTNLLSLNASIEAARAGESGRGFAVVAGEIRTLAEQSSESVQLIDDMLGELRRNRDLATKQSTIVKESVEKQNNSVNDTKEKYVEIVETTKLVNNDVHTLEQANQGLKRRFEQMNSLVENLSAVSEENSASSQEMLASTEYITNTMQQIKQTSDTVNNCATDLSSMIRGFKLDSE